MTTTVSVGNCFFFVFSQSHTYWCGCFLHVQQYLGEVSKFCFFRICVVLTSTACTHTHTPKWRLDPTFSQPALTTPPLLAPFPSFPFPSLLFFSRVVRPSVRPSTMPAWHGMHPGLHRPRLSIASLSLSLFFFCVRPSINESIALPKNTHSTSSSSRLSSTCWRGKRWTRSRPSSPRSWRSLTAGPLWLHRLEGEGERKGGDEGLGAHDRGGWGAGGGREKGGVTYHA